MGRVLGFLWKYALEIEGIAAAFLVSLVIIALVFMIAGMLAFVKPILFFVLASLAVLYPALFITICFKC